MKITDCPWELENLGKTTIEIAIDGEDVYNPSDFDGHCCEYLVVKVPAGKVDFRLGLPKIGFAQIESQFGISKSFASFDFESPLIHSANRKAVFSKITDWASLCTILESMTPMMFTTDRICLDPEFGPEIGLRRYRNWISTEFETGRSEVISIISRGIPVGFSMFRMSNDTCDVLLGGIFEQYQNKGLGLLTPISPVLYMHQNNLQCRILETSISSNNFPVIEFYNYLHYKIDRITNVFIKHQ